MYRTVAAERLARHKVNIEASELDGPWAGSVAIIDGG
jgi:hypothetical protein